MKPLIFTEQYHSGLLSFFHDEEGFLLFQAGEEWVMMLDQCSHLKIPLSTGWIEDGCVVCPWQQWKFDSKGRCTWPPPAHQERVPVFDVCEKDGVIWMLGDQEEPFWDSMVFDKHWRDIQPFVPSQAHWVGIGDSTLIWFGGHQEEVQEAMRSFGGSTFSTE